GAHTPFVQSCQLGSERDEHPSRYPHGGTGTAPSGRKSGGTMSAKLPIYLDYAATTPLDPRVAQTMIECLQERALQGNPSSMGHAYGRLARARVEKARAQVAAAIGARPD